MQSPGRPYGSVDRQSDHGSAVAAVGKVTAVNAEPGQQIKVGSVVRV